MPDRPCSGPPATVLVRPVALADRALFWAFALGCGLGLGLATQRLLRSAPAPDATAWVDRYGTLRPHVSGLDRAYFVHDFPADRFQHRLYRAQFELAPCVLDSRPTAANVPPQDLVERPLILDFHLADRLEAALALLEAAAAARGLELVVTRLPGTLAAVRARTAGQP